MSATLQFVSLNHHDDYSENCTDRYDEFTDYVVAVFLFFVHVCLPPYVYMIQLSDLNVNRKVV